MREIEIQRIKRLEEEFKQTQEKAIKEREEENKTLKQIILTL